VDLAEFDYPLPTELIAQSPGPRGHSRLLVLDRATDGMEHTVFSDLPRWLRPGDVLVVNNTRVIPARLLGRRVPSGGRVECLLLERLDEMRWDALVHPGQKLRPGSRVVFERDGLVLHGEILARRFYGRRAVRLWSESGLPVDEVIERIGHVPLPPYIKRPDRPEDAERYQTVYARVSGSVAAPTAGLHFTPDLLDELQRRGIERVEVTLHIGYGTFKPIRTASVEAHRVDAERYSISEDAAAALNAALAEGRRLVAVGTTTTRTLEAAVRAGGGRIEPGSGVTDLYIYPGFTFRAIGALITNFHLPRSSLLVLVAAFAGRDRVLRAYQEAIARAYRFYSYGDAMLIL
jgi:S-adenosylmethionine:tRNA ribosyltransferase-isomerase